MDKKTLAAAVMGGIIGAATATTIATAQASHAATQVQNTVCEIGVNWRGPSVNECVAKLARNGYRITAVALPSKQDGWIGNGGYVFGSK